MKNLTLLLITLFLSSGCSNFYNSEFTPIECAPEAMPQFDGNKVTMIDDDGNSLGDTILSQIEKRRTVFKPCREMIYRAIFKSDKGEVITNSRIKMMATGKRWEHSPEMQD